jgi:hypothetical protein
MNPIEEFLLKNGFKNTQYRIFENDRCKVEFDRKNYYKITFVNWFLNEPHEKYELYPDNLNIYWLIGVLTYYKLIDKDYKQ